MITFLTVVHIVVCLFLIVIVLLQHGKGADMGATFGGSSQTVFGTGGAATFLSKVTVAAVVIFMLTSMSLAFLSARSSSESLLKEEAVAAETKAEEKKAEAKAEAPVKQPATEPTAEAAGKKAEEKTPAPAK